MTTGVPTSSHTTRPARPRRSRMRRYLPLAVAVWLVLEIWLLTVVAGAAGGPTVFLLLLAGFVAGAAVMKRAGRRAFQNLNEAVQRGGTPSSRRGGNGWLMLAGLLLMIPGMISDALGLLLLVPPVQRAVGRLAERTVERKLRVSAPGTLGDAFQQVRIHRPDGKVVPGEVVRERQDDGPEDPRRPLTR
ncbi:FxsA family membrane protein [Streptomyces anandii]|uniref:FxsA family membrane protein n=1 Tax=Streptomyces anandii TaxID=285454 RepID=A0ABW6H639_9ACTN